MCLKRPLRPMPEKGSPVELAMRGLWRDLRDYAGAFGQRRLEADDVRFVLGDMLPGDTRHGSHEGRLRVPLVAPVHRPEGSGELPEFGVVIVPVKLVDAVKAAAVIRRHAAVIHSAILEEVQSGILAAIGPPDPERDEAGMQRLVDEVGRAICSVLSLSGRLRSAGTDASVKDSGKYDLVLGLGARARQGLRVRWDRSAKPSAFHQTYALMLAGMMSTVLYRAEWTVWEAILPRLGHYLRNMFDPIYIVADWISDNADSPDPEIRGRIGERAAKVKYIAARGQSFCRRIHRPDLRRLWAPRLENMSLEEVEDFIVSRKLLFMDNGVELKVERKSDGYIRVDPMLLESVLTNLLVKAADGLGDVDGARIDIDIGGEGQSVFIAVSDNGPGFEPQIIEAARRGLAVSTKEGHLGLGLVVTRGFAEACGGSLEVGRGEGGGARVRIWLPLAEEGREDDVQRIDDPVHR